MHAKPINSRLALITGASAGIGEAMAIEFARQKFDLVLVARSGNKLDKLAEKLRQDNAVEVRTIACDLEQASAPGRIFAACADLDVDILVNNAGVMYRGDFSKQDPDSIDRIVSLNIRSLTQLSRLFLQPMLARDSGRIMNVTSTAGFHASPTLAVYAASKGYILSFTEALSEELRNTAVDAVAFCPGPTETSMVSKFYGEHLRDDPMSSMLMLTPEEVARQGFRACIAGDPIAVPGLANRILTSIGRLQPRWLNRRMQVFMNEKLSGEGQG